MAESEIQIFSRMGCKMNDSGDALPANSPFKQLKTTQTT